MADQQQNQKELQIRAKDEALQGVYANLMQAQHSQEEFVIDFFTVAGSGGVLSSRVILSPGHVKRVAQALQENIKKYEEKFGEITPADQPQSQESIGFTPQG